jgi:ABC-type glycerol-3-phosphate transport system substrate-binding protein
MKIALSTIPGGDSNPNERFVFGGGTMVVIPAGAKHWELAWEWLKFLGGPEGAGLVQVRTADISGRRDTARDPQVLSQHIYRKEMVELFEKANSLSYLKSPVSQQWNAEMTRLQDRTLLKEAPIAQLLAEAQNEVQKALDEYWATA